MKNKYLTRFLCITLVSAMIAAVPFTTLATEYEDWLLTAQDWTESLASENGADPDDWMDEADPVELDAAEAEEEQKAQPEEELVVEIIPSETTLPELEEEETPVPSPSDKPENSTIEIILPAETEENSEDDILFEEDEISSADGIMFAYEEAPKETPAPAEAVQTATPTVTPTGTPTPTPTATPTPSPTPSPVVLVGLTTSMVSNLHAGKEFYLNSLSTTYGLSFSENFTQIMDQIENEYLAKYHLKRSDSTGLLSRDWQDVIAIYVYEQSKLGRRVFSLGSSDKEELAKIFAYLNPIMQTGPDAGDDASKWDYSKEHYYDPVEEKKNRKSSQNSENTAELFSGSEDSAEEEIGENSENELTDALWWQVPVEDPDGILNEIVLESAVDPSLYMENPEEAVLVSSAGLFDSGSSDSGRIVQFGNKPVAYANRHINYYIRDNNISRSDRSVLKKYTETDCKLLCATVTAAKGFVRQSVGDNVSEERVDVISAAYSLVGKVGYFWGGKSTYLGEDPAWGSVGTVTASGSNSTGTLRAYGLDCSGFVTWAVINGYEDKAMQSIVGDGTTEQWEHAKVVAEADAQPGDLVFQRGPEAGSDNHVGILVGKTDSGDWIAVHCSSSQNGVTVGEAYSASFRYIREPSFYPEKVEPTNIVLEENIDDILVDADLPGGSTAADPASLALFEDDFLDVVIVDDDNEADAPAEGYSGNTDLFEPYDPFMDTGGLVVLDETGPIAPEVTEEADHPDDAQSTDMDSDFAQTPVLFTDETTEPEEAGPMPQTEPEPVPAEDETVLQESGPVLIIDSGDGDVIASIDVDQAVEEFEPETQTPERTEEAEDDVTQEEDLPVIETIDIDEALSSEETDPVFDIEDALDEESIPEEVMELVVLEGLDWDDFTSEAFEEEASEEDASETETEAEPVQIIVSEEEQGPLFLPQTMSAEDSTETTEDVVVIDPELFKDSTPTPSIPVLEVYAEYAENTDPEGIVIIDPSSDTFVPEDLFSSQGPDVQIPMMAGETIVEEELIQVFENASSVTPTGTPVPKSFFSIFTDLFQ